MEKITERMRAALRETGLYSGAGKIVSAELAAYGAGLSLLFGAVEAVRRNMLVGTADAAGLAAFERLFRITPSSDSVENRRAMLLERGSVTGSDNTRAALERQLLAAGIRGNIVEHFGTGSTSTCTRCSAYRKLRPRRRRPISCRRTCPARWISAKILGTRWMRGR